MIQSESRALSDFVVENLSELDGATKGILIAVMANGRIKVITTPLHSWEEWGIMNKAMEILQEDNEEES